MITTSWKDILDKIAEAENYQTPFKFRTAVNKVEYTNDDWETIKTMFEYQRISNNSIDELFN